MNNRNHKNKPTNNTSTVSEITNDEFESEIVLFSNNYYDDDDYTDDNFEGDWVKKREKKGSTVFAQFETYPAIRNPKILTKVGHGQYGENTMSMIKYLDTETPDIIEEMKNILIKYPSIKRINIYGCKSGLLPIQASGKPLIQRMELRSLKCRDRTYYGKLSYAEFFILELEKSFQSEGKHLPNDIFVVACLGDVKNNNGKVGISGSKAIQFSEDKHIKVDSKSFLIEINCSVFLEYFRSCSQVRRNGFLLAMGKQSPASFFNRVPDEVLAKIGINTRNPAILSEREAFTLFSGSFNKKPEEKSATKENKPTTSSL